MPKIAYLTGIPGAGKSFVSRSAMQDKLATYIIGDEVRRRAVQVMCPNVKPRSVWSEGLWDQLCRHCKVHIAMDSVVNGYVFPVIDLKRPLLVDAYVTSHIGFREAFACALKRGGYEVAAEQLFWIDPPLPQVVQQANSRIDNGERPGEGRIDEKECNRRREIIVRRVRETQCTQEATAEEILHKLTEFFSS